MAIKIGIIGAGPAGLVTAIALEAYCKSDVLVEITLMDRNKSAMDYPGVEYGIQERACLALERIGIKDEALAFGLNAFRISFFNARTNEKQKFGVDINPDLTVNVLRQEFLAGLTNMLERTKVLRECNVKFIQSSPEKVSVLSENKEGKEQSHGFDILIAADGISSVVRKDYFKDENYIHNRGFSCLYMLIEVPAEGSQKFKEASNTGECMIVLGKTTTATFFPMGKDRFAVGIGFDEQTQAEMWHSAGVDPKMSWLDLEVSQKEEIAKLLAADCSFQDDMLSEAFQWIPDWNSYKIYLWKMRDNDVASRPYNQHGNVIMIGDAAHAIMPTIGMGASLAIEDAEILARHLSDHILKNAKDFEDTFKEYTSLRLPVWEELMARARAAAKLNFVGIRHRSRFAVGPQISGKIIWKIVTKMEEIVN